MCAYDYGPNGHLATPQVHTRAKSAALPQRDVWSAQGASCGVSPGSLLLLWCLRGWIGLASLSDARVPDLLQDLLGLPTKGTGALYR